jgi:hypothetical protein
VTQSRGAAENRSVGQRAAADLLAASRPTRERRRQHYKKLKNTWLLVMLSFCARGAPTAQVGDRRHLRVSAPPRQQGPSIKEKQRGTLDAEPPSRRPPAETWDSGPPADLLAASRRACGASRRLKTSLRLRASAFSTWCCHREKRVPVLKNRPNSAISPYFCGQSTSMAGDPSLIIFRPVLSGSGQRL